MRTLWLCLALWMLSANSLAAPPNIIVIFCDDLGYGDLSCYGAQGYQTPHLDDLAQRGSRWTSFYTSSPVCSASRAALLTGCYHERVGIRGALFSGDKTGLNRQETTIAECLKAGGYATGMAGKWHLGSQPGMLPLAHGFDEYLGIPYSNDMWPSSRNSKFPPLPLYEGDTAIDNDITPSDQQMLTTRFIDRADQFIRKNANKPFFFYLAPCMPHVPLFVAPASRGTSGAGLYGDVIQEVDAGVGRIVATLRELNLESNTLIVFTSDNGPWLNYGNHSGDAGPLREGKGTCLEGGIRVPMIATWPGKIPSAQIIHEPAATIDVFPTLAHLAGQPLPTNKLDGRNVTPWLLGTPPSTPLHEALGFYYANGQLQAIRSGPWKLLFPHQARTTRGQRQGVDSSAGGYATLPIELELYHLEQDIGETTNLAEQHPAQVERLQQLASRLRRELGDSLTQTPATEVRPAWRLP